jgi:hypothetical protein
MLRHPTSSRYVEEASEGPAYIREKPACPGGGAYTLNAVDTKPTCDKTADGHTL